MTRSEADRRNVLAQALKALDQMQERVRAWNRSVMSQSP